MVGMVKFVRNARMSIDGNQGLALLEAQIQKDLEKINVPPNPWVKHSTESFSDVLDVAIIGGGMAGLTASFALVKEGITNIKVFDENPEGLEGPWIKCARMTVLRSGKNFMGPALGLPSLTFWSWYEAQFGKKAWEDLEVCPTRMWQDYLFWYRKVLNLPVENNMTLLKVHPLKNFFELRFSHKRIAYARKVILATGRDGSGGNNIPHFLENVEKRFYAHTGEIIDPEFFHNKCIIVIGGGASAFDAAAVAIENGAERVDMLVRRPAISEINKFGQFAYPGLENGFYFLPDEMHCLFFAEAAKEGAVDPSISAVERIKNFKNLYIHYDAEVQTIICNGNKVSLQTNGRTFQADFIILGTGYGVDLSKRRELDRVSPFIQLWEKRVPKVLLEQMPMLGRFPYLGASFEFMESKPGIAPYLKDLYCFNYGAWLSHAQLSGDIPGISVGASRLAKGIATDFFLNESWLYLEEIKNWQTPDFNSDDYPPLKQWLGK